MFTTVSSNKKNVKNFLKENSELSCSFDDSSVIKKELTIIKQLSLFFSFSEDYFSLQLAIFCLTLILSIIVSIVSCLLINFSFGLSLFIGSITGIFYLRLLAKSIGNLGKNSLGVSKVQLLLPICLFIFASGNDLIEIFPAIMGFFFYKPAMLFYFSRS
tara:strand:- start:506 stop:982 length:477 start_codon:yes stop_codon:yes gene_type:complete